MSEQNVSQTQALELMEKAIEERINQARKEEVLDVYEDLLQTIWDRIVPTLGRVTVATIVQRSVSRTKEAYPPVGRLEVANHGLCFDGLRDLSGHPAFNTSAHVLGDAGQFRTLEGLLQFAGGFFHEDGFYVNGHTDIDGRIFQSYPLHPTPPRSLGLTGC